MGDMWLLPHRRTDDRSVPVLGPVLSRWPKTAPESVEVPASLCAAQKSITLGSGAPRAWRCRGTAPLPRVPSSPHPHSAVIRSRSFTNCVSSAERSPDFPGTLFTCPAFFPLKTRVLGIPWSLLSFRRSAVSSDPAFLFFFPATIV